MGREIGACLACKKPIQYFETMRDMKCGMCGRTFQTNACCVDNHYICDECHGKKGIEVIIAGCEKTTSKNPIFIMQQLMENPFIYMHGPEHHVMVGAALLTAYYNSGGNIMLSAALAEMKNRGSQVPGGVCGLWGCCGAGISTGIFMSIITKATPLTGKSWKLSNQMTSRSLAAIAELGGPRCCKRDAFTAAKTAVDLVKEVMNIEMEMPESIQCTFSEENQQCLKRYCPYHQQERDME